MSTTHGLAPRLVLDAPLPRQPIRGLLGSPGAATLVTERDHWQAGANIYPYPAAMPLGFDPCAVASPNVKESVTAVELPDSFSAFTAYLGEVCWSAGVGPWEDWKRRAKVALEARTSWALERQLVWGTFESGNPYLADSDVHLVASGAALAAAVAVSYLEGFLASRGQQGVIHATPEVVSFLGADSFIYDGTQLRTFSGTPVVVGQGYSNPEGNDDLTPSGASEAGNGQSWIFASSPVIYQEGELYDTPENFVEALDRDDNTVIYRAERDLWVAFDGGPHAAALADWSP